ncbi:MAG: hypothetical protein EAZ53_01615 [Bacteroidetes bacterium]|nr:MAG: hypothetical protein EAZ53_01615 [Bacteroidota bacterium]
MKLKHILSLFLCIFYITNAQFDPITQSKKNISYIFKLTEKEAEKIYIKGVYSLTGEYFHTLIDSSSTDRKLDKNLPFGHYIFAKLDGVDFSYDFVEIPACKIQILKNDADFRVAILDSNGNSISQAEAFLKNKKLKFDNATQTFVYKRYFNDKMLKVVYRGLNHYVKIANGETVSPLKKRQIGKKIIYKSPIKYVFKPLRYLAMMPYSFTKWAITGKQNRLVWNTTHFFRNPHNYIFNKNYGPYKNKFVGEIYTNKPIYKPNDTIKLKAVIFKKNNPFKKPFKIQLFQDRDAAASKYFDLKYNSSGVYTAEIHLHDSLNLKLDKILNLSINLKKYTYRDFQINTSVGYENYQLNPLNLNIKAPESKHYRNSSNSLFVKLTNENDLNILDGKLKIVVLSGEINKMYCKQAILNDTLLVFEKNIDPVGETEISIPDSIFKKMSMNYSVLIRGYNAEYEMREQTKYFQFIYDERTLSLSSKFDTLSIIYEHNHQSKPKKAFVKALKNDKILKKDSILLPAKIAIQGFYDSYIISADSVADASFTVPKEVFEPQIISTFNLKKPIHVYTLGKTKNKFSYVISRNNKVVKSGFADSLNMYLPYKKKGYVISYMVNNAFSTKKNTLFVLPDERKRLNLAVSHPSHAFPGQEIEVKIKAQDENFKPISNLDLLSYGITSKFETYSYYPSSKNPVIPLFVKKPRVNYSNHYIQAYKPTFYLRHHFPVFDTISKLSNYPYYRVLFPYQRLNQEYIKIDSTKTEFAPFAFSNNGIEAIQEIDVDFKPIYYGFASKNLPYSFPIDSGKHRIEVRTNTRNIVLRNIPIRKGFKNIISFDYEFAEINRAKYPEYFQIYTFPGFFTPNELYEINRRIINLNNENQGFSYVKQKNRYFPIEKTYSRHLYPIGPFDLFDTITFQSIYPRYSNILEIEPNAISEINKNRVKVRCDKSQFYKSEEFVNAPSINSLNFGILAYDAKDITNKILNYNNTNQYINYYYDQPNEFYNSYTIDKGVLLSHTKHKSKLLRNIYLQNLKTQSVHKTGRKYSGFNCILEEGKYRMGIILNETYSIIFKDTIKILKNKKTYFDIDNCNVDTLFTTDFVEIFDKNWNQKHIDDFSSFVNKKSIQSLNFNKKEQSNRDWKNVQHGYIEGQVLCAEDDKSFGISKGDPMIGATIVVDGTINGTTADIDGKFILNKVIKGDKIIISFNGFKSLEFIYDGNTEFLTIFLKPDHIELQEVVAVGYGESKGSRFHTPINSRDMSRTINQDMSKALQGTAAGVQVTQTSGAPGAASSVNIRGVGSINGNQPLYVVDGEILDLTDIQNFNPADVESMEVLKDDAAIAIYGSKGANGVVFIKTKNGMASGFKKMGKKGIKSGDAAFEFTDEIMNNSWNFGGLRTNFRDDAFWKPTLRTNTKGEATFKVKLPDDITKWNLFTVGYKNPKLIEVIKSNIHAAKPLSASLPLTEFLTVGDSAMFIGKTQNYFKDSLNINTQLYINDSLKLNNKKLLKTFLKDSIVFSPTIVDSIKIKYTLTTDKGYIDGEERKIPTFPQGLEQNIVQFYTLNNDTIFDLKTTIGQKITIRAEANKLDFAVQQIEGVWGYRYLCNEQLASKLKTLLAKKQILEFKNQKFEEDKNVKWVIKKLIENQNSYKMWSWWNNSTQTSYWISNHVLEALHKAATMGYKVDLNTTGLLDQAATQWYANNAEDRLSFLNILSDLKIPFDYQTNIKKLESTSTPGLDFRFGLIRLKQKQNLPFSLDTVKKTMQTTHLGNVYWKSKYEYWYGYANEIKTTLLAYQILKSDTAKKSKETLFKISNYILEFYQNRPYINTLEAANIIETLLPQWLGEKNSVQPKLFIKNISKDTITDFAFEKQIYRADSSYKVTKKGKLPVYLSVVNKKWNANPVPKSSEFEIKSYYISKKNIVTEFKQCEEIIQHIELKVLKKSTYVMLEVPIPAGCSFVKNESNYNELHREYYKEKAAIFFDKLDAGTYTIKVKLMPRYKGVYVVNPVQVCLMYLPEKQANTAIKSIVIK